MFARSGAGLPAGSPRAQPTPTPMPSADPRTVQADALLEEIRAQRGGQLKVFLGAAPGVGKTYAMLNAARELKRQGVDVVVGVVETHGRRETEALVEGLEVLPRQRIPYKERTLEELDLDAMLARKPRLALIDELAHRNAPGSRHERRYQDIEDLLDAGIDVYTTVNIQHIESLNDVVQQITGVRVRETVPDAFMDRARDVVLIDLPPRELIERLQQGKVYVPDNVASALASFFTPSNLTALRELSVQAVADRVDSDLREYLQAHGGGPVPVKRRVVVAIDGRDHSEYLVRVARRIAERRQAPWAVAYVDTGGGDTEIRATVDRAFDLARRLGAETELLRGESVVDELLSYANRNGASTIVIGRTRERPLMRMLNRTLTQQLLQKGARFELTLIATPYARARSRRWLEGNAPPPGGRAREYGYAVFAFSLAMGLAFLADRGLKLADLSPIFLVAVMAVAARRRMALALATALACFAGVNFFFTAPRYSLVIANQDDLLTLLIFLASAVICSTLATRLRSQVLALRAANAHAAALQELGQKLTASADEAEVCRVGVRALAARLGCDAVLLRRAGTGELQGVAAEPPAAAATGNALAAANWAAAHAQPAGRYTDTLAGVPWWFVPLVGSGGVAGVAGLRFPDDAVRLSVEQARLAQAMVQEVAQALDRTRLVADLESTRVQGETERLRNALLASVSHDLRSPLASIIGSASSLEAYGDTLPAPDRRALLETIRGEGERLDRYIQNLLDMTRLGHGTLKIERDWVGLDEVAGAAIARLRRAFPAVAVDARLDSPAPLLHVHPALIEQALFNILENAARFSPPGAAVVLSGGRRGADTVIEVSDAGPGIPDEERARIFDMFYSVGRGDRGAQGTGLGLAICQGMVGAHGGRVEALAGADGRGTTIRITLPMSVETPPASAEP